MKEKRERKKELTVIYTSVIIESSQNYNLVICFSLICFPF